MVSNEDTESNPFLGYANGPKSSLNGASLNGASLNGASLNGASLNGASLNGASLNGASLASFHSHFHKAAVAQSPVEVSKHLTSAVDSVSPDTPSNVKQEYFNLAQSMLKRRSNTTLPSIDSTRIELDSNLRSLVDSRPSPKSQGYSDIARRAVGLAGLTDTVPKWAMYLAIGLAAGCVYKKATS